MPNLENSLTTATNTTPTFALAGSAEIQKSFRKGRVSAGLRAGYLLASVATDSVELSYKQLPVLATLGYVLGASRVRLRAGVGAGYALQNAMTITGSGTSTDGSYSTTSILGMGNVQLTLFPSKSGKLGIFGEAGYVYALSKILYHTPFTSPDLDGDASGLFFQGGVALRF
jgi:hypothetical protein